MPGSKSVAEPPNSSVVEDGAVSTNHSWTKYARRSAPQGPVPEIADHEPPDDDGVVIEDQQKPTARSETTLDDAPGEIRDWKVDRLVRDGTYYRRDVATFVQSASSS